MNKNPASRYLSEKEMSKSRGAPRRAKPALKVKPIPTHSMSSSDMKRTGKFKVTKKLDAMAKRNLSLEELLQ